MNDTSKSNTNTELPEDARTPDSNEDFIAGKYIGLRLALIRAAHGADHPDHNPQHVARELYADISARPGAPPMPSDARIDQHAAVGWFLFHDEQTELCARAIAEAVKRAVSSLKPPRKRPKKVRNMKQAIAALQDIHAQLAAGLIDAPSARAQVYAIQTLIVVMKATAPEQLTLPPAPHEPVTIPALKASAAAIDTVPMFPTEPPDLETT